MRVAVDDRLLLELDLAGVLAAPLDAHGAVVVAVELPQDEVVDGGRHLRRGRGMEGGRRLSVLH